MGTQPAAARTQATPTPARVPASFDGSWRAIDRHGRTYGMVIAGRGRIVVIYDARVTPRWAPLLAWGTGVPDGRRLDVSLTVRSLEEEAPPFAPRFALTLTPDDTLSDEAMVPPGWFRFD